MYFIFKILVAVVASVVGHCVRKWLDRNDKDN